MPETDPQNQHDLELLLAAARAAGDVACQFHGPDTRRWDKPDGAGPVTEADLAVNRLLEDRLRSARPDYGWLSEESENETTRQGCSRVFIIDPIDGTRSFAEGSDTWAHSLAIAKAGQVVAAAVFLPRRELMFAASLQAGATCNGAPIQVSARQEVSGSHILCAKPALAPHHWRAGLPPEFQRSHRPSLAYRLSRVADGTYDAMLTLRPTWEWDIAAGDLILREAGGQISTKTGAPLRFNSVKAQLDGVVAAGAALHAGLLDHLAAAG